MSPELLFASIPMSTTTTALTTTDILPSSVPKKLLPTGLNWTAFSIRFKEAIEAKGFWGHFDGTSLKPIVNSPPGAREQEALNQWMKDERSTKALLTHHIPDSTLIRIHTKESLQDRWDLIVKEYCKGNLTDLRRILHLSLAKGNPK
jgi:hypothetical protein